MIKRVLLFRNLIDNIPKNIGLYSVGVMLLFLFRVTIDSLQFLLGLLAFMVSYSSIYVLNDLCDIEDDKKDEKKVLRKPLAHGVVNRSEAVTIFISFFISNFLFLHSSIFNSHQTIAKSKIKSSAVRSSESTFRKIMRSSPTWIRVPLVR